MNHSINLSNNIISKNRILGCVWFNVKYFPENKYFLENKYFSEMLFSRKENIFKCLVAL